MASGDGGAAGSGLVLVTLVEDLPVGGTYLPAGSQLWTSADIAGRWIADRVAVGAGGPVETATGSGAAEEAVGRRGRGV